MKILILGGSAFFGKETARILLSRGHDVTLFNRGNKATTDLPKHGEFKGDRGSVEDLKKAASVAPWDVVIDNLAFNAADIENFVAAFKSAPPKKYILNSTVSVYRFLKEGMGQPLIEDNVDFDAKPKDEDPSDIHWKYARGKLEAEKALRQLWKSPWTIIRPPVVYGPQDPTNRGFWYLSRILSGKPIVLANDGSHSFRLVFSGDAALSFVLAAESEKSSNRTYNVAQAEVLTLKKFLDDSAAILGKRPDYVSVPLSVCKDLAGPYASMINLIPDSTRLCTELDFRPTAWNDFATLTAQWFVKNWKGDEKALLATRSQELALAEAWKSTLKAFSF